MCGDDSCPNELQSQSSTGGLEGTAGVEGQSFMKVSFFVIE